MLANQLRTQKEKTLFRIALVFSILIWVALLISIVGAIYGVLITAFVAVAHVIWISQVTGNGVRIGPDQLPDLWKRIEAASQKLGLEHPPEVYILQSGGLLNALATKLFSRRFIILFSNLIEACEQINPSLGKRDVAPTELDFIIGHEMGHIANKHLSWVLLPARIIPLLGPAYSRACEYTCDACGHAITSDINVSSRALGILAGGPTITNKLNMDSFVEQRKNMGKFWMAVCELNASHPYLPKRVAALREREQPGYAPELGRNPFSYPLAPFFAFATGGPAASGIIAVIIIGILAAIAIPSFRKYVERARQAKMLNNIPAHPSFSKEKDGWLLGGRFAWKMKLPSSKWTVFPDDFVRKQNPMADRWATRRTLQVIFDNSWKNNKLAKIA